MKSVAFLRGINIGPHHKVPMAELRAQLKALGCTGVETLLNSGNVIFEVDADNLYDFELRMEELLSAHFQFSVPVVLRTKSDIDALVTSAPFANIELNDSTRLYVSFLKDEPGAELSLPYQSADGSYRILSVHKRIICSVLDLSVSGTPAAMGELERLFGKGITTRNWNTIVKIASR